jgi:hypothetical protein
MSYEAETPFHYGSASLHGTRKRIHEGLGLPSHKTIYGNIRLIPCSVYRGIR